MIYPFYLKVPSGLPPPVRFLQGWHPRSSATRKPDNSAPLTPGQAPILPSTRVKPRLTPQKPPKTGKNSPKVEEWSIRGRGTRATLMDFRSMIFRRRVAGPSASNAAQEGARSQLCLGGDFRGPPIHAPRQAVLLQNPPPLRLRSGQVLLLQGLSSGRGIIAEVATGAVLLAKYIGPSLRSG
jgi:hypothetical protein